MYAKSNQTPREPGTIFVYPSTLILWISFFFAAYPQLIRGHDPRIEVEVRMISADKVRTDMKISAPADHRENGQTKDIGSQTFKGKQTNKHTLTNTQE